MARSRLRALAFALLLSLGRMAAAHTGGTTGFAG